MDLAKLSRLQRWIICAALDNRSYDAPASEPDLCYHQILTGYFGFPERRHGDKTRHSHPGSHRFDRDEIGRARYDAAQASLSRAARRLQARGLAERRAADVSRRTGVRLTDTGLEAALELERQRIRTLVDEALGRARS